MSRLKTILLIVVASFALSSSTAGATQFTYSGPEWYAIYGVANTSGWNYPQLNRVYRPAGYYFTIYYTDGSTYWGYKRNFWDNPLVWPYAGGYAKSVCIHSDHDFTEPMYPVTCQYLT